MQCPITSGPDPRIAIAIIVTGTFEIERHVCLTQAEFLDLTARLASEEPNVAAAARSECMNLCLAKPGEPLLDVRDPATAQAVQVIESGAPVRARSLKRG